jgi:membrane protease YdiL (CAAX protease family)
LVLFVLVSVYHAFSFSFLKYLTPLYLLAVPFIFQKKVRIRPSIKDISAGVVVSVGILLPFALLMLFSGRDLIQPSLSAITFQLVGVALPEEVYFRGYLQERIGNNIRGVLIVSVLFSLMHVPQFVIYGDLFSPLTFFPSLVMGYLYMRTYNVLTSTIFHFGANMVFLVF